MEFVDYLGSEISDQTPENALFHVIPVPYEKTVSYGSGTVNGPSAILDASHQLEVFDGFSNPCEEGIYTWPAVDCSAEDEVVIARIKEAVKKVFSYGEDKFPFLLGGEHTVTNGPIQALHELGIKFGIVQFDAHADLRDAYEGNKWSHASVMKRAVDLGIPLFQLGVRAISPEEVAVRAANPDTISYIDGFTLGMEGIPDGPMLPEDFPELVFISIDVDGMDPTVVPATGTPVPGGISWFQMQKLLRKIVAERTVIGADMLELAPMEGFHAPDFAMARLTYDLMGLVQRSRKG